MLELYLIAFLGFALHFTGRYGEYWRAVEKIWPWHYVLRDPPAWIGAVLGTLIAILLMADIAALIAIAQVEPALRDKLLGAMRLLYFLAGYGGSSIVAKLPGLILPKFSNPTQR